MRRHVPPLLITGIFVLFVADALFQIALPTLLVRDGGLSATAAGLLLSLGMGIGVLVVAPIAQYSDARPRSRVLLWCGVPLAAASLVFAAAAHGPFSLALWVVPILIYGLLRTPTTVVLLAYVTERGDGLRMQAGNGIAQRGAVACAALIVAWAAAGRAEALVFILLAVAVLLVLGIAGLLHQAEGTRFAPAPMTGNPYRRSFELLRARSLKASSALNASIVLVTILGNAFYPLGLLGESPETVAFWVLVFLVSRDLFGAIAAGSFFKVMYARIGIVGALAVIATLFVGGLAALAIPGRLPAVIVISAVLQGFGCATAIGCTNILAAHGGAGTERALRIGTTQYLPAFVMLLTPAPFGLILDYSNIHVVFGVGAVTCLVLMAYVLYQVSPRRNTLRADLASGAFE